MINKLVIASLYTAMSDDVTIEIFNPSILGNILSYSKNLSSNPHEVITSSS